MYCIAYNTVKYQQDILKFKKLKSSIDWSYDFILKYSIEVATR